MSFGKGHALLNRIPFCSISFPGATYTVFPSLVPAVPILGRRGTRSLASAEATYPRETTKISLEELPDVLQILVQFGTGLCT